VNVGVVGHVAPQLQVSGLKRAPGVEQPVNVPLAQQVWHALRKKLVGNVPQKPHDERLSPNRIDPFWRVGLDGFSPFPQAVSTIATIAIAAAVTVGDARCHAYRIPQRPIVVIGFPPDRITDGRRVRAAPFCQAASRRRHADERLLVATVLSS
jgi:hypothetical protein